MKVKVTKAKVFKPGKGKKRAGGRHTKVRRSDAAGTALKKALAAFPTGGDAFTKGMPATAPGDPNLPLPDPAMALGMPPMKRR